MSAPESFARELESLLNYYSQERPSNTPDFVLATYLLGCLAAYNQAVVMRDQLRSGTEYPISATTCPTDPETGETVHEDITSVEVAGTGGGASAVVCAACGERP